MTFHGHQANRNTPMHHAKSAAFRAAFFMGMPMLKRLLPLIFALITSPAFAYGTIPGISMAQQLDTNGTPLNGGKVYLIQAGTTSTPQNCYQDTGLSIAWPNPIILDSSGRVPQLFCADGSIKVRITDSAGVQKFVGDNILVVGASGGGGGGSSVDATTILATGDIKTRYGTGNLSGFVRANGRTIGSATSGATERANADCQTLFEYLWNADSNLAVSGGRGASANADWTANKTIALPDWRGRVIAGLDDMGNTAASRLSSTYFGATATTLGASGGAESKTLLTANLPPYTPSGTMSAVSNLFQQNFVTSTGGSSPTLVPNTFIGASAYNSATTTFTGTAQGGTSTPVAIVQPTMLATIYIKL